VCCRRRVCLGYHADAILFGALGYSGVILTIKWSAYAECARPIHVYLLVDYLIIALFRIAHLVSKCVANHALWVQKTAEFVKVGLIYRCRNFWPFGTPYVFHFFSSDPDPCGFCRAVSSSAGLWWVLYGSRSTHRVFLMRISIGASSSGWSSATPPSYYISSC